MRSPIFVSHTYRGLIPSPNIKSPQPPNIKYSPITWHPLDAPLRACGGLGLRVYSSGFRFEGLGFRIQGSEFRVQDLGFSGVMFRV